MSCDCSNTPSDQPAQTPPPSARRGFMLKFGLGLMGIGGAIASIPIIGYAITPALKKYKNSWIDLGGTADFPEGETRLGKFTNPNAAPTDGESAEQAVWVRSYKPAQFQVFAVNCAHLGCPVKWFQQSKLFMCPCHGGVYYEDGSHASGPPPRGLFEYKWKIVDGRLLIDAGRLPGLEQSV